MNLKIEFEAAKQLVRDRRYDEGLNKYKEILENSEHELEIHYWSLKYFADIVGILYYKDYFKAIDIYQKIINEYEGEDGLYEWCQVDMAKTYLQSSIEMMNSYENMVEMLTSLDDDMDEYINNVNEEREDFITTRAEAIYKERM